jgi:PAS domain S-box-containing protein
MNSLAERSRPGPPACSLPGLNFLSLRTKGLCLVLVPVLFQISLLSALWYLRSDADSFALAAGKARVVSIDIGQLSYKVGAVCARVDEAFENNLQLHPACQRDLSLVKFWCGQLEKFWCQKPESRRIVQQVFEKSENLVKLVIEKGHDPQLNRPEARRQLRACIDCLENELEALIITLRQPACNPPVAETAAQSGSRQLWFLLAIAGTFLNLAALLLLGIFFSRDIVSRLDLLTENSFRLSRGRQLLDRLPGRDEIAQLDLAFHQMADAHTDAAHKQKALYDNARDLLCSLDRRWQFISLNSAVTKVLGYSPAEMVGRSVCDIVDMQDLAVFVQQLQKTVQECQPSNFELRLQRSDDSRIHTCWSAVYDAEEDSLFCVIHDISEQKAAERMRKEVLQMVSHDLRNPLAAIRSAYDMLESGAAGELNRAGKAELAMANTGAERMLLLVNQLLDIEKLEAGMLQLEKIEFSLRQSVQKSIDAMAALAEKGSVSLTENCPDLQIIADPHRIEQILANLLSNAIKFSPPNSGVIVSAQKQETFVEISVSDRGRGVPPDMTTLIFERFSRVQKADERARKGSGLGLAICKALVELHGGKIGVESRECEGSRFFFSIPC